MKTVFDIAEQLFKIDSWIHSEVSPARRHKCEACLAVFECHLCTINYDHPIHVLRNPKTQKEMMFVCEECCEYPGNRYQKRNGGKHTQDMLNPKPRRWNREH